MTKQEIDAVLERVRTWPEERQREAALALLDLEQEGEQPYELTDGELRALDEAEASGVASDGKVRRVFERSSTLA